MSPPLGPFARGGRRRGPPPFVVQILRAPLTLNNIIALAITWSVHRSRQIAIHSIHTDKKPGCDFTRTNSIFGILTLFFAASIFHNLVTIGRFHRIRKQVFGESICAMRRRCRRRQEVALGEEEMTDLSHKFREMGKRMPSLLISVIDIILSLNFLGLYVLTTLLAKKEQKVGLGVAYASIGALVAFIFNFIIGINGVKLWARQRREKDGTGVEEAYAADVKEPLLEHD